MIRRKRIGNALISSQEYPVSLEKVSEAKTMGKS